jgi:hypothetical protein
VPLAVWNPRFSKGVLQRWIQTAFIKKRLIGFDGLPSVWSSLTVSFNICDVWQCLSYTHCGIVCECIQTSVWTTGLCIAFTIVAGHQFVCMMFVSHLRNRHYCKKLRILWISTIIALDDNITFCWYLGNVVEKNRMRFHSFFTEFV